MPDMAAMAQALEALKSLKDFGEVIIGLRDAAAFKERKIEFQQRVIDAQSAVMTMQQEYAALTQHVGELEEKLAKFETWETDKKEYEMSALVSGSIAYAFKSDAPTTKPAHYICANCYEHRKRAILQIVPRSAMRADAGVPATYRCPECKSEIIA